MGREMKETTVLASEHSAENVAARRKNGEIKNYGNKTAPGDFAVK